MLPSALLAETPPGGPVLLEVFGAFDPDKMVAFDLAGLDALPQQIFQTSTPWTEGVRAFSGPSLGDVLETAGFVGKRVRAEALNDYHATFDVPEPQDPYPILCTRIDGHLLTVREHGPVWIIYPFDDEPRYLVETALAASVWHLVRLVVLADA